MPRISQSAVSIAESARSQNAAWATAAGGRSHPFDATLGQPRILADDELAKVLYSQSQSIRQGAAEKRDANALDAIGRRHLAEHHFAHALHGLGVGERLVCFEVIGV